MELGKTKFEVGDQVYILNEKTKKCEKVLIHRIWVNIDPDCSIRIEYGVVLADKSAQWVKEEDIFLSAAELQKSIFANV